MHLNQFQKLIFNPINVQPDDTDVFIIYNVVING